MFGRWMYNLRACLYSTNTSFMCLESTKMDPFCIVRVDDSILLWHENLHHFAGSHGCISANGARPAVWQCVLNEACCCSPRCLQRDWQDECRHQAKFSLLPSCYACIVVRNLQSGASLPPCPPRTSGYLCFQSCEHVLKAMVVCICPRSTVAWSGMCRVVAHIQPPNI